MRPSFSHCRPFSHWSFIRYRGIGFAGPEPHLAAENLAGRTGNSSEALEVLRQVAQIAAFHVQNVQRRSCLGVRPDGQVQIVRVNHHPEIKLVRRSR